MVPGVLALCYYDERVPTMIAFLSDEKQQLAENWRHRYRRKCRLVVLQRPVLVDCGLVVFPSVEAFYAVRC